MKIGRHIAVLFMASAVYAADFQVSASLDRNQIALNEQAVMSLTISGSGNDLPQPELPGLSDFQIYNAGRSQNYTWVNGKASASVTYNFVLTPLREGHFTIPAIHVQSQGQSADTSPLTLDVVKGDASAAPGAPAPQQNPGQTGQAAQRPPAVFITGTVDKTSVYVGEPLIYTFRFYNRVQLFSRPNYQPPETTGFWLEDLPPQRNFASEVKGIPYNVTEVRSALFPSSPGKAKVGSAGLTVHLENFGSDPFGSQFFAQFFGRSEEKTLRTDPVGITVKALPEPKPAEFKGAVGEYTLNAEIDKEKIAVGQPLTLTLTIAGRGNIKSLPELPLPALTNFRTFDANAATNIEKKDGAVAGSKVFKTVLIPTASGELTIPPIPFAYFNPADKAYRTVRSKAITVRVEPGAAGSAGSPAMLPNMGGSNGQVAGPAIKRLGEDIRYIKTPAVLTPAGEPLYRKAWFRWSHIFLLALLGLGGIAKLYHRLFLSDAKVYRFRKAREQSMAALKNTEDYLSKNDIKGAAGHLADTLQDFLAAKLGAENRTLSLRDILDRLKARGLTHTAEKMRNVWETLDLYQFAPAQVRAEEVRSAMDTVGHVIEDIDKEITWKN